MIVFWMIAAVLPILRGVVGGPVPENQDRFLFSNRRREPENADYGTRTRQNNEGGSNIENIFKIPIAVIKGTSAAAQAFYPQSTDTINKIFDIPVMTLDAVGNYIKERPQRLGTNSDDESVTQRPSQFGQQRPDRNRDERRERITRLREQEREERRQRLMEREERQRRQRLMEQEKFFLGGHSSIGLDDVASALTDLFGGGGHGHHHHHHHGHQGHQGFFEKPHKRPVKPVKPTRPHKPHRPGHHHDSVGGDGGYEVYEDVNESPAHLSGIFSWLQGTPQSDYPKIQNKIAPGFDYNNDRDIPEFRVF